MRVKILGSAAGGGFPQWNCACSNCSRLRAGTFKGKARTQTQVAISQDGHSWFLLGASPDLRAQIQSHGLGGIQAKHYDRHDYMAEKTAALAGWAAYLQRKSGGNVAHIHGKTRRRA